MGIDGGGVGVVVGCRVKSLRVTTLRPIPQIAFAVTISAPITDISLTTTLLHKFMAGVKATAGSIRSSKHGRQGTL